MTTEPIAALEQRAEADDAAAACALGDHYRDGNLVPQDWNLAARWYRRAAESGDPNAQNNLGSIFLNGLVDERDPVQATHWYRKAAEQGLATAQYNLAKRYLHGDGIAQDFAQAYEWFAKAALQGDVWSSCEMGTMHWLAQGRPRNLLAATELHLVAAEDGDEVAIRNLAEYRKELEDIALSGSQMASLWLCRIYNRGFGVENSQAMTWAWILWAKKHCRPDPHADVAEEVLEAYDFYCVCITSDNRKEGQRLLKALRADRVKRAEKPVRAQSTGTHRHRGRERV